MLVYACILILGFIVIFKFRCFCLFIVAKLLYGYMLFLVLIVVVYSEHLLSLFTIIALETGFGCYLTFD